MSRKPHPENCWNPQLNSNALTEHEQISTAETKTALAEEGSMGTAPKPIKIRVTQSARQEVESEKDGAPLGQARLLPLVLCQLHFIFSSSSSSAATNNSLPFPSSAPICCSPLVAKSLFCSLRFDLTTASPNSLHSSFELPRSHALHRLQQLLSYGVAPVRSFHLFPTVGCNVVFY